MLRKQYDIKLTNSSKSVRGFKKKMYYEQRGWLCKKSICVWLRKLRQSNIGPPLTKKKWKKGLEVAMKKICKRCRRVEVAIVAWLCKEELCFGVVFK
jgi:hypothetical protein